MAAVPSSSTTVCITPPPAYSESPAATAPPEYLKNEQLFSAAGFPPAYSQQPQNPWQAGSQQPQNPGQATFPPHVVSPASPGVGPVDTNVVPVYKRKKCTCRNVMRVLGCIGIVLLVLIFFVIFLAAILFGENLFIYLPIPGNCSCDSD